MTTYLFYHFNEVNEAEAKCITISRMHSSKGCTLDIFQHKCAEKSTQINDYNIHMVTVLLPKGINISPVVTDYSLAGTLSFSFQENH